MMGPLGWGKLGPDLMVGWVLECTDRKGSTQAGRRVLTLEVRGPAGRVSA